MERERVGICVAPLERHLRGKVTRVSAADDRGLFRF